MGTPFDHKSHMKYDFKLMKSRKRQEEQWEGGGEIFMQGKFFFHFSGYAIWTTCTYLYCFINLACCSLAMTSLFLCSVFFIY